MYKKSTLLLVFMMSALTIPLYQPVFAQTSTITVPDDYSTIQAAIDAASAGDTIFVKKGVYNQGNIRINKEISLIGEDPLTTCINLAPSWIEYSNPDPFDVGQMPHYDDAIRIEANDVRLSGFTINNTVSINGGLSVVSGNRVHIIGNIILNNIFHISGGYCVFALNTAACGVSFYGGYGTIAGNMMPGGSIWVAIGKQGTVIYGNTIIGDTEGIAVGGDWSIVTNNTVIGSKFGLSAAASGSNNVFYANMVINNKAGLRMAEGDNNTFYANHVENNSFGVEALCYFPVGDNNTLFRNNFIGNTKQVYTDSVYIYGDGSERIVYLGGYFDDGKEGNYWSDYTGFDADGDGVGDVSYIIDANRQGHFPVMSAFEMPVLSLDLPEWAYVLSFPLPPPLPLPVLEDSSPEDTTPTATPHQTQSPTLTPTPTPTETATQPPLQPSLPIGFYELLIAVSVATVVSVIGLLIYLWKRHN